MQARVRIDFSLEVGNVSESVEVVGATPLLQTDSSYLGQVVESKRIDDLPLNGRYVTRLAVLSTGAVPTTFGAPDTRTGGFSANGVRPYENNYMLDGVDNSNLQSGLTSGATYVIGPAARCHRRIQGADQLDERGVRPLGRRGDERHHQVGHQPVCTVRCTSSCATAASMRRTILTAARSRFRLSS